jgi:hypothetical protein
MSAASSNASEVMPRKLAMGGGAKADAPDGVRVVGDAA